MLPDKGCGPLLYGMNYHFTKWIKVHELCRLFPATLNHQKIWIQHNFFYGQYQCLVLSVTKQSPIFRIHLPGKHVETVANLLYEAKNLQPSAVFFSFFLRTTFAHIFGWGPPHFPPRVMSFVDNPHCGSTLGVGGVATKHVWGNDPSTLGCVRRSTHFGHQVSNSNWITH